MRKLAAILLLPFAFSASFAQAATTPGAIPGSFGVSESGAATYNIPIAVPPGIAGIEPKLSLAYNSQGGNGLLGMGWSLGGLSVIHRCPKTVVQDGVHGSVNYNANDRYCLDGQRLVAINGTYGADATEYRTESESYSRIVSYGSQGSGPASWKVWTKSGQIIEYGNTADSRIEAQGKTEVMLWNLNNLSDTVGNTLTVSYIEDNPNGQYYPDRIDYTGNANAGKSPQNSVRFVYETRADITPIYQAGSLNKNTVRLKNVQTHAGVATLVRDYRLEYELSVSTQRSRLVNVQECPGSGECLSATSFVWQSSESYTPAALQSGQRFLGHPYGIPGWVIPFDYDGDGYQDLAIFNSSSDRWYTIAHNNRDGTFTRVAQGQNFLGFPYGSPQATATITAFDYNGDGKQDLLFVNSSNDGWYMIGQSNGDGTFSGVSTGQHFLGHSYGVPGWVIPFDFNGDGRQDIAIFNSSSDRWYTIGRSNGDGTFTRVAQGQNFLGFPYGSPQATATITAFDYNGDGKQDLLFVNSSNDGWYMIGQSNGDGTFSGVSTGQHFLGHSYGVPGWVIPFDFNGDGRQDIAIFNSSSDRWYTIGRSNGDGTFTRVAQGQNFLGFPYGSPQSTFPIIAADFNQDGMTDLAFFNSSSDRWYMFVLSNGNGTFRSLSSGQNFIGFPYGSPQSTAAIMPIDNNGNGRPELLFLNDSTDGWFQIAQVYNGAAPDVISAITTGHGATTTVTYKPLTADSVYTKDSGAVYPYVDIQVPMYVAAGVAVSDGMGGNFVSNYTYTGAKSHLQGGGFLGFRQVTAHVPQAHIRSTTTYRQDYPYHGQPLSTQKHTDSGVLLGQNLITYTDQFIDPSKSPVWRQSLPARTVESSYELDGSPISSATSDTQYDSYGNPTSIVVNSGGGYSKTTTNLYDNIVDPGRWFLGRLRRSTVNSVTP